MQKCKDGPAKKTLYSVLESFQSCGWMKGLTRSQNEGTIVYRVEVGVSIVLYCDC